MPRYDALILVSFGGPEGKDDVMPFLERVLRGRDVPKERLREVAGHYDLFGGRSPINDQCRALLTAIDAELLRDGPRLPVYWGNRNWHPLLPDTIRRMAGDGVGRALAFVTSAFGSYSGCRQYLEDIARARAEVGAAAPEVDKLRGFHNHPGFVEPLVESVAAAIERVPAVRREACRLVFTAHSIPRAMAASSPTRRSCARPRAWSRRRWGDPASSWRTRAAAGRRGSPGSSRTSRTSFRFRSAKAATDVVVAPIGFVSDHMEVVYDLDLAARSRARELGLAMVRAATVGTHPRFVRMIRELVVERHVRGAARPVVAGAAAPRRTCARPTAAVPRRRDRRDARRHGAP